MEVSSRGTRKNVVADAEKQLFGSSTPSVQPPQSPSPIFIGSFCFSRFPLHTQWTGMFPLLTPPAISIARFSSGSSIDCSRSLSASEQREFASRMERKQMKEFMTVCVTVLPYLVSTASTPDKPGHSMLHGGAPDLLPI